MIRGTLQCSVHSAQSAKPHYSAWPDGWRCPTAKLLALPDIVGMTASTGPLGTLGRMATTIALPISGYFGASRESAHGP